MPLNLTPAMTFGNWFVSLSRRQVFDAAQSSLKTISLAVVGDNEPFVRTARHSVAGMVQGWREKRLRGGRPTRGTIGAFSQAFSSRRFAARKARHTLADYDDLSARGDDRLSINASSTSVRAAVLTESSIPRCLGHNMERKPLAGSRTNS